jgi:ABC-type nitrate/sulfonate/bicarbonate transport system substrate-binding protein
VLVGLLQKGDIEAMVNVDPLVLRTLESGGYREIMDLDGEWQSLTGSRLLVTTIAVWDDYAANNPDQVKRLIQVYRDAVAYIEKHPEVYAETGFIKMSGLEATPAVTKAFQQRFTKLYTGVWNQKLIDANKAVFDVATEMGNLGAIPKDWYSFDYAK